MKLIGAPSSSGLWRNLESGSRGGGDFLIGAAVGIVSGLDSGTTANAAGAGGIMGSGIVVGALISGEAAAAGAGEAIGAGIVSGAFTSGKSAAADRKSTRLNSSHV